MSQRGHFVAKKDDVGINTAFTLSMKPDDKRILHFVIDQGIRLVRGILKGQVIILIGHGVEVGSGEETGVGKKIRRRADAVFDAVAVEAVSFLFSAFCREAGDDRVGFNPMILEGDHEVIIEGRTAHRIVRLKLKRDIIGLAFSLLSFSIRRISGNCRSRGGISVDDSTVDTDLADCFRQFEDDLVHARTPLVAADEDLAGRCLGVGACRSFSGRFGFLCGSLSGCCVRVCFLSLAFFLSFCCLSFGRFLFGLCLLISSCGCLSLGRFSRARRR